MRGYAADGGHGIRPRPRLIIADDHKMIAESLSRTLVPEFEIVGTASDGDALLPLVARCAAECLLLDIAMPGKNGLELLPAVRVVQPAIKILVVTMFVDRMLANAALDAGADGFLPKDAGIADLKLAIREVIAGRRYVSQLVPKFSHRTGLRALHPALQRLTPRQQEVVILLGEGKSETDIAAALGLSVSTITFHKHNIMRTLGVQSNAAMRELSVLFHAGIERTTGR